MAMVWSVEFWGNGHSIHMSAAHWQFKKTLFSPFCISEMNGIFSGMSSIDPSPKIYLIFLNNKDHFPLEFCRSQILILSVTNIISEMGEGF